MTDWPQGGGESYLTGVEKDALDLSAKLAQRLFAICASGGDADCAAQDWNELAHHLHYIQRAIQSNAAARIYPTMCRPLGGVIPAPPQQPLPDTVPTPYTRLWICPRCRKDNDRSLPDGDRCHFCGWEPPPDRP